MEATHEAAEQTLSRLERSVVRSELQDDQLKAAAKIAERRGKSSGYKAPARTKTRFKREHTV